MPENEFQNEVMNARDAFAITLSDTVDFATPTRAIYVGSAGTLVAVMLSGAVVSFPGAQAGSVIPIQCTRVNLTGTTASMSLVGLV